MVLILHLNARHFLLFIVFLLDNFLFVINSRERWPQRLSVRRIWFSVRITQPFGWYLLSAFMWLLLRRIDSNPSLIAIQLALMTQTGLEVWCLVLRLLGRDTRVATGTKLFKLLMGQEALPLRRWPIFVELLLRWEMWCKSRTCSSSYSWTTQSRETIRTLYDLRRIHWRMISTSLSNILDICGAVWDQKWLGGVCTISTCARADRVVQIAPWLDHIMMTSKLDHSVILLPIRPTPSFEIRIWKGMLTFRILRVCYRRELGH